jgi:hypothetical protein
VVRLDAQQRGRDHACQLRRRTGVTIRSTVSYYRNGGHARGLGWGGGKAKMSGEGGKQGWKYAQEREEFGALCTRIWLGTRDPYLLTRYNTSTSVST